VKNKLLKKNKILYWIYKIQKIYKNKSSGFHYGEFAEDIAVNRIFKNKYNGNYLDIGAYHPFKGSLTYLLYKKGWNGTNIDISKTSIDLFNISRPKDNNINCAIGKDSGKTYYFENSPINQQNSLFQKNQKQLKIEIEIRSVNKLIEEYKLDLPDYINIDTEGNEIDVLNGIDFSKIKPSLLTIEDNSFNIYSTSKKEKIQIMEKNGYQLINIIGVTMFFFDKEHIDGILDQIEIK